NPRQRQREIFRWLPRREGRFRIIATLKAPEEFEEKNTRNNAKTTIVQVLTKPREEFPLRLQDRGSREEGSIPRRDTGESSESTQRDRTRR
ncbi:MAG: hypothetical protein NC903_02735, partial [Candidatus Omnitrophica bacterium]|nr:hypothetical protein [Candidatus Omnitrophota bacterium]